ncbi:MAG TPA: dTMP kinase [Solirubrobacteraceae bacterium]|jgi:dTMP kinase|nr:dTMP kinase [Solirubrobacteraceae bacterium]
MARGRLITIEGIDGAGKSTLAAGLVDALAQRGVQATLLREPGGVRTAERIRELVHDPAATIGARAEALLYAAARAQLVEEALEPLLAAGQLVLLDRFVDSSLAYQGAGRDLGIDAVRAINAFGTGGLVPDRTLLLRIDPAAGRTRSAERGAPPDRLEQQPDAFFERIAAAYDALAASDGDRMRVIDADQPPSAVLAEALAAIADVVA